MQEPIGIREAATKLGVTKQLLYKLISEGRIAPPLLYKVGAKYLINVEELDKWIAAGGHLEVDDD